MKDKKLSEKGKEIIEKLNHPLYTTTFLEEWDNRSDNALSNIPAALQAMGAHGYMDAVRQICKFDLI